MGELSFASSPVPLRDEVIAALPPVWASIGAPGTWLTGAQRVAVAAETRKAVGCALCEERKDALSPDMVQGEHDCLGELPEEWIDLIHRIISDPSRLSERTYARYTNGPMTNLEYVEIVGVVVRVVAIDTLCRGIGMEPPAIPLAKPGEPSREETPNLEHEVAWVPTLNHEPAGPLQNEFYPGGAVANIRRALTSVVPTARDFWAMANVLYLSGPQMRDFSQEFRAISHAQIELVAGRVSALNQCVY
jgi:hypothetical protein